MTRLDQKFEDLKKLYPLPRRSGRYSLPYHPLLLLPPVLHIAGTNGKGSTAAFLQSILQAAGYLVHTYTSPHLHRVNERIVLQGKPIEDDLFLEALEYCEKSCQTPHSWFELLTHTAFWAFSKVPADVIILETGVGGALDATNVFEKPLASILTPISFDHMDFLGYTLQKIAQAKAGIIKEGVPVISAMQPPEVLEVIQNKTQQMHSPLFVQKTQWDIAMQKENVVFSFGKENLIVPQPPLHGMHQIQNLGVALATLAVLKDHFTTSAAALNQGILATHWPGRLQKLTSEPVEIWIDGAHNPAAADVLSQFIQGWSPPPVLIWGMLRTKDATAFLAPFKDKVQKILTIPIPDSSEGYDIQELAHIADKSGFAATACPNLEAALKADKNPASPHLITGSLRLVAEALALNFG